MTRSVELHDEVGQPIGVTVKLGSDGETLADRIEGWSKLQVLGEDYPFSRARAAELLRQFPHFAEQLEAAPKPKAEPTKGDPK